MTQCHTHVRSPTASRCRIGQESGSLGTISDHGASGDDASEPVSWARSWSIDSSELVSESQVSRRPHCRVQQAEAAGGGSQRVPEAPGDSEKHGEQHTKVPRSRPTKTLHVFSSSLGRPVHCFSHVLGTSRKDRLFSQGQFPRSLRSRRLWLFLGRMFVTILGRPVYHLRRF